MKAAASQRPLPPTCNEMLKGSECVLHDYCVTRRPGRVPSDWLSCILPFPIIWLCNVNLTEFRALSLFSDLRTISGTALINLLAALFMVQLLFVIGVGGVQVKHTLSALYYCLLSLLSERERPICRAARTLRPPPPRARLSLSRAKCSHAKALSLSPMIKHGCL